MNEFNLQHLSIKELVERRNADCRNDGWVSARGQFHAELREAFLRFGIETKNFNLHTYLKYQEGRLVPCDKPRYRIKASRLDGSEYYGHNVCQLSLKELDLAAIIRPKIIVLDEDRLASVELVDTEKRFQIVSLDEQHEVIGNAAVIGHLRQRFTQQVFGRIILIIPFDGAQKRRIALGQRIGLTLISNS